MEKILDSLEELFFKIISLTFLIPKTLWKCFYDTKFSYDLVSTELAKAESKDDGEKKESPKPFQDYASPIQIYLFAVIIPLALIVKSWWGPAFKWTIKNWIDNADFLYLITSIAVFSCYWPLQETFISLIIGKHSAKKNIQAYFNTYLLNFSVAVVGAIIPSLLISILNRRKVDIEFLFENGYPGKWFIIGFSSMWFITVRKAFLADIYTFTQFHGTSKRKAIRIILMQYIFFFIVYWLLFFVTLDKKRHT